MYIVHFVPPGRFHNFSTQTLNFTYNITYIHANPTEIRDEIFGDKNAKRTVIKWGLKDLIFKIIALQPVLSAAMYSPPGKPIHMFCFSLLIDVWSERTFIVIDINHFDFDFDTAHKTTTSSDMPMLVTGFS